MAAAIAERPDSRIATAGDQNTVELRYNVTEAADEAEALAALIADSPATQSGPRKNCRVEPVGDGSSDWTGTVTYGGVTIQKQSGTQTLSFDTTGGTQHITQAKEHIATHYIEGDTPPDFKGAIGVTDDSVEGCNITVPVFAFAVTRIMASTSVAAEGYVAGLFALTGKTNNAAWSTTANGVTFSFAEGEVLFLGASGSPRGDNSWEITFRFAASPNADSLTIGDFTGIAKKGWEYLWVQYKDAKDTSAKCVIKKPKRVVVDRVYDTGDFSALGC